MGLYLNLLHTVVCRLLIIEMKILISSYIVHTIEHIATKHR